MPILKVLQPGDEELLKAFLSQHADTSMFLRSNLRTAGLVNGNQRFQGIYVAAIENESITAVAAHYWNGMLAVQAPIYLEQIVRVAVAKSNRMITAISGEAQQVHKTRKALKLENRPTQLNESEILLSLALDKLRIPPALASKEVECRNPLPEELDLLAQWRVAFSVEALGETETPQLLANCHQRLEASQSEASNWVLITGNTPVAYCAFNARLDDIVQIGGVYTPPALRNRGYSKCVIAGCLLAAKSQGVKKALLFTSKNNIAAQAVYKGVGFEATGKEYGLLLFKRNSG